MSHGEPKKTSAAGDADGRGAKGARRAGGAVADDAKRGDAQSIGAERWSIEVVCRKKRWQLLRVHAVVERHRKELEMHGPIVVSEDGSPALSWAQWQRLFLLSPGDVAFQARTRAVEALVKERERDEKLDRLLQAVERVRADVNEVRAAQEKQESERLNVVTKDLQTHLDVVRVVYQSMCPCCRSTVILDADGRLKTAFACVEHMFDAGMRALHQTWLVCNACHLLKRTETARFEARFKNYQQDVSDFIKGRGPSPYPKGTLMNP